MRLSRFYMA